MNYYICSFKSHQGKPDIVQRIRASCFSEAQELFVQKNRSRLSYGTISAKLGDYAHGYTYDPNEEDEDDYDNEEDDDFYDDDEEDDYDDDEEEDDEWDYNYPYRR